MNNEFKYENFKKFVIVKFNKVNLFVIFVANQLLI
jgi:hypothetical protein